LGVDRDLACLCAENKTGDSYIVAYVEKLFEYNVVEILVFTGTKFVAVYIHLNASLRVLQLHE
jgi:hypothetical protein